MNHRFVGQLVDETVQLSPGHAPTVPQGRGYLKRRGLSGYGAVDCVPSVSRVRLEKGGNGEKR